MTTTHSSRATAMPRITQAVVDMDAAPPNWTGASLAHDPEKWEPVLTGSCATFGERATGRKTGVTFARRAGAHDPEKRDRFSGQIMRAPGRTGAAGQIRQ